MQTNEYGKIPNTTLISALGASRTTVSHTAYAPSPEVCLKCSHFGDVNFDCSLSCPHRGKKFEVEKTYYVYESKKISSENRMLPLIGIKTLIYLHMLTKNGGINDFDIKEAAKDMKCCTLSVKNALNQLEEKNYILFQKDEYSGLYTIIIKNYTKDLNRTAENNSLGYITLNKRFASSVMACKTITSIRLLLRAYHKVYSKKQHTNNVTVYVKEFMKSFPEHVSKNHLIAILKTFEEVLKFGTDGNRLSFYFSPIVNAEACYAEERIAIKKHITDLIDSINKNISIYRNRFTNKTKRKAKQQTTDKIDHELRETILKLQMLGFNDSASRIEQGFLREISLTDKECTDFTNIAIKYGTSVFDKALIQACEETPEFTIPTGALKSRAAFLHSKAKELVFWQNQGATPELKPDYHIA